jgi:hypothetical protein
MRGKEKTPKGSDCEYDNSVEDHVDSFPATRNDGETGQESSGPSSPIRTFDAAAGRCVPDDVGNTRERLCGMTQSENHAADDRRYRPISGDAGA